jgi:hypothetical protein
MRVRLRSLVLVTLILLTSCVTMAPKEPAPGPYVRSEWKHWIDEDKDCEDTRAEILKQRSEVPVKIDPKSCTVRSGSWKDYYYPEVHVLASKVDIDHLIPLKHAHESGGANWTAEQKMRFANDPRNLVITNRKYNRTKGAKTPLEWLPSKREYACKYLKDWLALKKSYRLRIASDENSAVEGCQP